MTAGNFNSYWVENVHTTRKLPATPGEAWSTPPSSVNSIKLSVCVCHMANVYVYSAVIPNGYMCVRMYA